MEESQVPRQLSAKVPIVDFAFHPVKPLALLGLVNGKIKFYNYEKEIERMLKVERPLSASVACRSLSFMPKEEGYYLGGFANGNVVKGDIESGKAVMSFSTNEREDSIYILKPVNNNLLFTGHDSGEVKLFDLRLSEQKPTVIFSNTYDDDEEGQIISSDDWVSDIFLFNETGYKILVSRSDGTICTYTTRRGGKELLRSEPLGAEITGMVGPMKNGKKFLVSATDGAINIFNWKEFGNISDRFPISRKGKLKSASGRHSIPISVDSVSQFNDSLLFAGCGDGKIRLLSVQPNASLAIVGTHEDGYPVERLRFTPDKEYIASSCYDGTVRFWSTEPYKNVSLSSEIYDSEGNNDSSDSGDSGDGNGPRRQPRLKKRKKELKKQLSHRINFFADLDDGFAPSKENKEDSDISNYSDSCDDSNDSTDSNE